MDEPKPPAPETSRQAPLAEVPEEFPAGLLEPDGSFIPDYDPPERPFGVWILAGIALLVSATSARQALAAVTRAGLFDFLTSAGALWAYGFAGWGVFRGNHRGHTTYLVLLIVNLVICAVATVITSLIAANLVPSLLEYLSPDALVREFLRNAALALVAGFSLALAMCGLLITYLESKRVREWVGKNAG